MKKKIEDVIEKIDNSGDLPFTIMLYDDEMNLKN